MKKSLPDDSIASRQGGLSRHWDLLAAAGVMMLAGVLAWVLHGGIPAPTETETGPPVARPSTTVVAATAVATVVAAADEQHEAVVERSTPNRKEQTVGPTSTATAQSGIATRLRTVGVDRLVGRWLASYCKSVEERYEQRGREQWRCSWRDVHISGSLPTVDVEFTRVDRAVEEGNGATLELLAPERFHLTCADDACRRLASVPGRGRTATAERGGTATTTNDSPEASQPRPNRPPVVEIVTAPQRAAPGERVVLEARVTDPDSASGDEVECTWSVDGKPVARLCWQLVWTVPTSTKHGNVIFTLKARDRNGASDSKSVSAFVGPAN